MLSSKPPSAAKKFLAARADLLCVLILIAACLLLRVPSLDRVALNPDESQYEATASYLAATDSSAFLPYYGAPGTFGLYKLMTRLFGQYPSFEVRVLVLLLCLFVTLLLYVLVRRETNPWCGLAAGLIFLHYTMPYEGLTVNREWFALLMSMIAIGLYAVTRGRAGRPRDALLMLSGLAAGMALLFKLQASFIVFAIPAVLAWQAARERSPRQALRTVGFHAAGGLLAGAIYLAPFLLAGTLGQFLDFVFGDVGVYVEGNEQAMQGFSGGALRLYIDKFYWGQSYRPLLLTAFFFALVSVGSAVASLAGRFRHKPTFVNRPGVLVFATYLVTAVAAVKLGNRFFDHYYLLMMPAVAAMTGLALYWFVVESPRHTWSRRVAAFFVGLIVLDRLIVFGGYSPRGILAAWPQSAFVVAYLVGWLAILVFGTLKPRARLGIVAAALVVLETGLLVYQQQRAETPSSMYLNPYRYDSLAGFLRTSGDEGDRLFVWGWAPEIYTLTRLESATAVTTCEYVVNDFLGAPRPGSIDPAWSGLLMRQLRERMPRFIVDASARSWSSTAPSIYRLARYPDFEFTDFLRANYEPFGRFDGCEVYVRRGGAGSEGP